ncbi:hypothetical protein AcW1_008965 [Taiwanofungus camphoratus]|nr:hypothetical protein AcW1_008965 [Antrodia cinnamomea]
MSKVVTRLGLSYTNVRELNNVIDTCLPSGRPAFKRSEIVVAGQAFEVFYRDIIKCVRALYGDPEMAPYLLLAPERHYTDTSKKTRVYFDMHTGKWWWATQEELEKTRTGATIIPIIISSDKTQLTLFGNKTAYPVYLTIGNLPKEIRRKPSCRGQILLAYLPTSHLEHIASKAARRRALANLFHACMKRILASLKTAGEHGLNLTSGDGVVRRGHLILATYIGDYPEQLLVTCCKNGDCPKCPISNAELGEETKVDRDLRDLERVQDALATVDEGPTAFTRACKSIRLRPIMHPFWEDLPYLNIFASITPDILHQLYQGIVKHVISWIKEAYGPEELDARCRRLPPNHNIRLFAKGISLLQKVTGKEHADICRILPALIIGLPLRGGHSAVRLIRAVRALLDFLYLAQYPAQTSETLKLLSNALVQFHANKGIFIDLGIRLHFRLPKLHALDHYLISIRLFGTTDNYDTQYSERLHIDFAKDAYRATNRKDEFPQMTMWLERREKIERHEAYIRWRIPHLPTATKDKTRRKAAPTSPPSRIQMTRNPSVKGLLFSRAVNEYGATYLRDALARFIVRYRDPTLTPVQVERASAGVYFPFQRLPVFHKIKISIEDVQGLGIMNESLDVVHARPHRTDKQNREVPGRFDTVLINEGNGAPMGVTGKSLIYTLIYQSQVNLRTS